MYKPLASQFAVTLWLNPPGSISVAPSGMPVPPDPFEPGMPSGDVIPTAGFITDPLVVFCARTAPQPMRITAAVTNNRRIDASRRCRGSA
jgi:hypothetical protein